MRMRAFFSQGYGKTSFRLVGQTEFRFVGPKKGSRSGASGLCRERERETARELELELERRLRDRQNGTERRFDECARTASAVEICATEIRFGK